MVSSASTFHPFRISEANNRQKSGVSQTDARGGRPYGTGVANMIPDEIDQLLSQRPIPVAEIVAIIAESSLLTKDADFTTIERIAYLNQPMDQYLAYPAMAALPAWGEQGIDCLCRMAAEGPHSSAAFAVLSWVSLGRVPASGDMLFLDNWDLIRKYGISGTIASYAQKRLREVMLDHLIDPYMKSHLLQAIASPLIVFPKAKESRCEHLDFLVDMLVDSHMVLNRSILYQFESLLDSCPDKEEELHQFLVEHPILLDPFVTELRTKHELGDDFITDFGSSLL